MSTASQIMVSKRFAPIVKKWCNALRRDANLTDLPGGVVGINHVCMAQALADETKVERPSFETMQKQQTVGDVEDYFLDNK